MTGSARELPIQLENQSVRETWLDQHDVGSGVVGTGDVGFKGVAGDEDDRDRRRYPVLFQQSTQVVTVEEREPRFSDDDIVMPGHSLDQSITSISGLLAPP